ncbi:hypothetical protein [Candidatus Amarolinea dominans]
MPTPYWSVTLSPFLSRVNALAAATKSAHVQSFAGYVMPAAANSALL